MNYNESGGLSASDVALLTGRNNNDGFGDGNNCWWIILLLLALGGWNNGFGGNNGGYGNNGYGCGFNDGYAWLSNGQKEIMQNTNNGFDTLHLSNQIEGTRDAINNISTQLCDGFHGVTNQICNSTAGITNTLTTGFYNAEIAANNRQMADMQQNFNNQVTTLNGFNNLNNALQQCLKKIFANFKNKLNFLKFNAVGTLVG